MGISFGSTSIKPYVGGKEVAEAYVGSQLVYQNTPPYEYAFLGTENSYELADWCELTSHTNVEKIEGVNLLTMDTPGHIKLNITSLKHKNKISFDCYTTIYAAMIYIGSSSYNISTQYKWEHREFTIPNGITQIEFTATSDMGVVNAVRLNAIRIE